MFTHKHTHSQLEQMDLEIHDLPVSVRRQAKQRLENYRHELKRIEKEFVSPFILYLGYSNQSGYSICGK